MAIGGTGVTLLGVVVGKFGTEVAFGRLLDGETGAESTDKSEGVVKFRGVLNPSTSPELKG